MLHVSTVSAAPVMRIQRSYSSSIAIFRRRNARLRRRLTRFPLPGRRVYFSRKRHRVVQSNPSPSIFCRGARRICATPCCGGSALGEASHAALSATGAAPAFSPYQRWRRLRKEDSTRCARFSRKSPRHRNAPSVGSAAGQKAAPRRRSLAKMALATDRLRASMIVSIQRAAIRQGLGHQPRPMAETGTRRHPRPRAVRAYATPARYRV